MDTRPSTAKDGNITDPIRLAGNLSIEDVDQIAAGALVELDHQALQAVAENRRVLEELIAAKTPIYGITTGFGALLNKTISPDIQESLQVNLLRSHAAGTGKDLPNDVVRAALAVRINGLLRAQSGVRPTLLERIALYLNRNYTPRVPQTGSLGASGDLAPSAHAFLPLIGEGEVLTPDGAVIGGQEALRRLDIQPFELQAKEGLALINGTHFMNAIAALAVMRVRTILDTADIAAALTIDALRGSSSAFDPRVQDLRPIAGQRVSAENIARTLNGSNRIRTINPERIQDAYSLRCAAAVHGASREAHEFFERLVNTELKSVTDNPLIFNDPPEAISAGNFHGQSLALGFDTLRIALTDLAAISERRLFRLLSPSLNNNLPAFLSPNPGSSSGYMITQYTAAALITELRALAHPVSLDTISTSDNQEDHVSMGMTAALMTLETLPRIETVLAFEILCACQAFDLDWEADPSPIAKKIHTLVREKVPPLNEDRSPAPDVEAIRRLIVNDSIASLTK